MLSQEQVAQFQQDGCLNGPKVLSDEQVEVLRLELSRVLENRDNPNVPQPCRISNMNKSETPVWQVVNIWQGSNAYRDLISHAGITEAVAQLSGAKELRLWHDQIQYKPAGDGGINNWHQDWPYWANIAPMTEQVTAWVALDDVDESNGCMSMVSGSHKWGNAIKFVHTIQDFKTMGGEYEGHKINVRFAKVKKGEVHFHHGLTWHGSHGNSSMRPRRAIALHYMTEKTCYVNAHQKGHPMQPLVEVPENTQLRGDYFPLAWNGKPVAVKSVDSRTVATAK